MSLSTANLVEELREASALSCGQPMRRLSEAASTIEHQLSVIGELQRALKECADTLDDVSRPGVLNEERASLANWSLVVAAAKGARKALSHPIIGDKS